MTVSLRPVVRENWQAVTNMKPAPEQMDFLHSNLYSLAEAYIRPDADEYIPLAIHDSHELVGFAMYCFGPRVERECWIARFMVAPEYQRKGIGAEALRLLLAEIRGKVAPASVHLTCHPNNEAALGLYAKFGFLRTGRVFDGQDELRLEMPSASNNPAESTY